MHPDDATSLAQLETDLAKTPGAGHGPLGFRVPWLIRLVKELDARVKELEAGGIPDVIAQKDAVIAARDAEMAVLAEQLARLEQEKLPNPSDFFRAHEKPPEIPKKDDRA